MSKHSKQRPEEVVEAAENPAKELAGSAERPETRVEIAEDPAKALAEGKEVPAEKPAGKVLRLDGVQIPVIAVTNPHYGLSGPTVSVTVSVLNEDGSREGLLLNDVPERLIK